jgi:hypothetical protein
LGEKFGGLGAELGIIGIPGLGASGRISGGDTGVGGGGVPSCPTSGPSTGKPGGTQFVRAGTPIGTIFRHVHRSLTEDIQPAPDTPGASNSE